MIGWGDTSVYTLSLRPPVSRPSGKTPLPGERDQLNAWRAAHDRGAHETYLFLSSFSYFFCNQHRVGVGVSASIQRGPHPHCSVASRTQKLDNRNRFSPWKREQLQLARPPELFSVLGNSWRFCWWQIPNCKDTKMKVLCWDSWLVGMQTGKNTKVCVCARISGARFSLVFPKNIEGYQFSPFFFFFFMPCLSVCNVCELPISNLVQSTYEAIYSQTEQKACLPKAIWLTWGMIFAVDCDSGMGISVADKCIPKTLLCLGNCWEFLQNEYCSLADI